MTLLCRTCASVIYNTNAKNIFDTENTEILGHIEMVAGIALKNYPDLPSHICGCCLLDVKRAVFHIKVFRERCIKTQDELIHRQQQSEYLGDESYKQDCDEDSAKTYKEEDDFNYMVEELFEFQEDVNANDTESNILEETGQDADSLAARVQNEMLQICEYSNDSLESEREINEPSNNDQNHCTDLDDGHSISSNQSVDVPIETFETREKAKTRPNRAKTKRKVSSSSLKSPKDKEKKRKTYRSWKNLTEKEIIERKRQQRRRDCVCDQCGRHFSDQSNFKLHMLRHTGIKNFKCGQCNKAYYTEHLLQLHERIVHRGERPYACKYCEKTFHNSTTRVIHERAHTKIRPYSCGLCNKSFISASGLKRHEIIHSGVRAFHCTVCDKTFQRNTHLKAHLKSKQHSLKETNMDLLNEIE